MYWNWTLSPVKDACGNVKSFLFSLFETTERKGAEQMLEQYRHQLEQKVADRTTEIETKIKELEELHIIIRQLSRKTIARKRNAECRSFDC